MTLLLPSSPFSPSSFPFLLLFFLPPLWRSRSSNHDWPLALPFFFLSFTFIKNQKSKRVLWRGRRVCRRTCWLASHVQIVSSGLRSRGNCRSVVYMYWWCMLIGTIHNPAISATPGIYRRCSPGMQRQTCGSSCSSQWLIDCSFITVYSRSAPGANPESTHNRA